MTKIEVSGYVKILALHRAIYCAKFSADPIVPEIPGSAIIAAIAHEVVEELMQHDIDQGQPSGAEAWERWLRMNPSRPEWEIALKRAAETSLWQKWSDEEKTRYCLILLSPFKLSPDLTKHFIHQVDQVQLNIPPFGGREIDGDIS